MDNCTNFEISYKKKLSSLLTYFTKTLYITSTIKGNVLIVKEFLFYSKYSGPKIAHELEMPKP